MYKRAVTGGAVILARNFGFIKVKFLSQLMIVIIDEKLEILQKVHFSGSSVYKCKK